MIVGFLCGFCMAKSRTTCWYARRFFACGWLLASTWLLAAPTPLPPPAQWMTVPRVVGRLGAEQLGLVINTADPYSVEVGEHYIERRHLAADQVLRVVLPLHANLSLEQFEELQRQINAFFPRRIQALALAWVQPYSVQCHSITGALALGVDPELCHHSCAKTADSPYFNSASARPFTDHRLRPSMLLAAPSVEQARALIHRGVASDRSLGLQGSPPVDVYFAANNDAARSVRAQLFPPTGLLRRWRVNVHTGMDESWRTGSRTLMIQTGAAQLGALDGIRWMPGALADHLTSYGGVLDGSTSQTTALAWIASGATASYGTVSEPCAHLQKFPHPQLLLLHYLQGATALEAYWKSVAWPRQGLFIGEPLAAPFARR
jgi:uncharacterized protein (TIGR03790 family)